MMKFDIYGESHIGNVRESNEDCIDWFLSEDCEMALACLADGMGGYTGGEIASHIAVETVYREVLDAIQIDGVQQFNLENIFSAPSMATNQQIFKYRAKDKTLAKMGTTLTAGIAVNGRLGVMSVGDSRCYRYRGGELIQITKDDSVAQAILEQKDLGVSHESLQPFKHLLTKALGTEESLVIDVDIVQIESGDQYLFCSDGLTNEVDDYQIAEILSQTERIPEKVRQLVEIANESGGRDNISVILLQSQKFS